MAYGLALVTTNPESIHTKIYTLIPSNWEYLGWIHYGFAGSLFLVFAVLCIKVFTLWQERDPNIPKSIFDENNIYKTCGWLIILFVVLVPFADKLFPSFKYSTLLLEALSLFAFGTSWLIKGRAIGDTGWKGRVFYGENNEKKTS